jgi:hypothetical protein
VRLLVEILITACKLMSVKEHLYLLLFIFKQENFSVAHGKEISVQDGFFWLSWRSTRKLLAGRMCPVGRYLLTPALVGFESTTPASERAKTVYALYHAATVVITFYNTWFKTSTYKQGSVITTMNYWHIFNFLLAISSTKNIYWFTGKSQFLFRGVQICDLVPKWKVF